MLKNKPTFEDWMNNYSHRSNWEIKKFADSLKDIICILIGCTRKQLEDRDFKETSLGVEWRVFKHTLDNSILSPQEMSIQHALHNGFRDCFYEEINLTPRLFLQKIGTDLFRNQLHPNTWVSSTFANYLNDAWIITDVRFPNELQAIKDRNGIVIRVNRNNSLFKSVIHESETILDNATFDYIVDNNSDIQSLIEKVKIILEKENIL